MSTFIRISSEDKETKSSVSNSDFIVYVSDKNAMQKVTSITPIQVWAPNVFYNIRSSYSTVNNTLYIQENGQAAQSVAILEGQYTSDQLIVAIQNAVNAAMVGSVLTITLDAISKIYTFTFVGNTVILYNNTDGSTIGTVIGLTTTTANQLVHLMDEMPNLNGLQAVYFHSKQINDGGFIDGNTGTNAAFTSVDLSQVPFGGVGYREVAESDSARILYPGKKNLSTINIILRDAEGNRLPIGAQRITVIFRVTF